ncbi:Ethylene-responsive transcription factor-like protein [Vigna angularis]|uniref:Ethylene-responsive transcription factor-like protein n=1 Tax=Phaseolus angularis TaxID=3914 RepID=A0A8T0KWT8_PHAAN|nr:Ethylene-responsive transcription factor-like protein [Vigna angularis]
MVSLRRRRLLGLCSGNSSFVTPLPLYCENLSSLENSTQQAKPKSEQPVLSDDASNLDSNTGASRGGWCSILDEMVCWRESGSTTPTTSTMKSYPILWGRNTAVLEEPGSSNVSGSSSSKEQLIQPITGPPIKRRKRHRRKNLHNQEPCLMRGVYFKNMKWQAAIKVDKKQIHLGTVGSQEEAAHLYDRAAFMCGREPNFELPEEEKRELSKFKWDDFLAMTRQAITRKKHKRRLSPGPGNSHDMLPLPKDDWDSKQGVSEDAE